MLAADMNTQVTVVGELLGTIGTWNIFDADVNSLDVPENVFAGSECLETDRTRRLSGRGIDPTEGLELVVVERGENGGAWQHKTKKLRSTSLIRTDFSR